MEIIPDPGIVVGFSCGDFLFSKEVPILPARN